jgi:hypothetical protein
MKIITKEKNQIFKCRKKAKEVAEEEKKLKSKKKKFKNRDRLLQTDIIQKMLLRLKKTICKVKEGSWFKMFNHCW